MNRLLLLALLLVPVLAAAQVEFDPMVVAEAYDGALNVTTADVDGDGDLDMIAAAETADYFIWLEQDEDQWIQHVLSPNFNGPTNVGAADIDGDGDMDILGASYTDDVVWWSNEGDGTFTANVITSYDWIRGIEAWDFDGDGDLDLGVCNGSQGSGEVVWLEQPDPIGDFWPVHVMSDFDGAANLDLDDIDGDGDVDAVTGGRYSGDVAWIENLGNDTWTTHILNDSFGECRSVKIADIDGDGLKDVVATSRSDDIAWWRQTDGTWPIEYITTTFDGADDVYAGDIDLDGDMDVVGAAVFADEVAWFEQTDDGWVFHSIGIQDYVSGVHAADIDDDGDLDVIGAGYYSDNIVLYTQLGEPEPDLVTFNVTPQNTSIPPNGGMVTYGISLQSILATAVPGLTYWTMVEIPNGQVYGPLMQIPFTMTPFMDVNINNMSQAVPAAAPGGNYQFEAFVGYMGNPDLQLSDGFTFNKIGATANGAYVPGNEWVASGDFPGQVGNAPVAIVPGQFRLSQAYPNPFNSQTQLSVSLPQASELAVTVHNIAGQQVARLAQGWHEAGQHSLTFDASALAAGVYFVRADAPGYRVATQKVLFLK